MDGFDFNSLSSKRRVMIVCSTWGEGEQPDNAEDLWQFSISDSASRMEGVHFAVLALGDSSYEFFCQSGKEWDAQFEKLGPLGPSTDSIAMWTTTHLQQNG